MRAERLDGHRHHLPGPLGVEAALGLDGSVAAARDGRLGAHQIDAEWKRAAARGRRRAPPIVDHVVVEAGAQERTEAAFVAAVARERLLLEAAREEALGDVARL